MDFVCKTSTHTRTLQLEAECKHISKFEYQDAHIFTVELIHAQSSPEQDLTELTWLDFDSKFPEGAGKRRHRLQLCMHRISVLYSDDG